MSREYQPQETLVNVFEPRAAYNVAISENRDTLASVEAAHDDRGVAIGADGKTIERARELAARHFTVDDVELT